MDTEPCSECGRINSCAVCRAVDADDRVEWTDYLVERAYHEGGLFDLPKFILCAPEYA